MRPTKRRLPQQLRQQTVTLTDPGGTVVPPNGGKSKRPDRRAVELSPRGGRQVAQAQVGGDRGTSSALGRSGSRPTPRHWPSSRASDYGQRTACWTPTPAVSPTVICQNAPLVILQSFFRWRRSGRRSAVAGRVTAPVAEESLRRNRYPRSAARTQTPRRGSSAAASRRESRASGRSRADPAPSAAPPDPAGARRAAARPVRPPTAAVRSPGGRGAAGAVGVGRAAAVVPTAPASADRDLRRCVGPGRVSVPVPQSGSAKAISRGPPPTVSAMYCRPSRM